MTPPPVFVIVGTFAGLQGLVTLRTGHVRTFTTREAADAVAAALRPRARLTTYAVMEQRAAQASLDQGMQP